MSNDDTEIAERDSRLIGDSDERAQIGEAARVHLQRGFDPERLVEKYVEFLSSADGGRAEQIDK